MRRPSTPIVTHTFAAAVLAIAGLVIAKEPAPSLDEVFHNPPMEARPSGYWWWLYNNVDKASITRDLEEFRDKGMGAVLLVCSGNWSAGKLPEGPAFLSPGWKELYLHALREAARLDLKVDMNIAPGWNMGGPWITPENACRWYLQSELEVEGPRSFRGNLPLPDVNDGYEDKPQLGVANQVRVPMEEADYRDTAVVAFRVPEGKTLKNTREDLAAKAARADANCFVPPVKVMSVPRQPWASAPGDVAIPASQVVDLSAKLDENGMLEWDVPEGRWMIVRTGHRKTGAKLSVALPGQEGLENDFFDRAGVEQMFEHTGRKLAEWAGPLAGTTLRAYCSDSFEAGYPNWTANMPEHFKRYRGYEMLPYLPVLKGYIVGSAEISERFLHDYRKTLGDCMADEHYGRFAELCAEYGIEVRAEPSGPSWSSTVCLDGLKNLGRTHFPQGEFWRKAFVIDGQNHVGRQTASGAHVYGRRTASAEAFTSMGNAREGWSIHWSAYPEILKPLADRAFCEGINHVVFHTLTAQRPQDGKPGYEYGAGTHFNPNVTWWDQAAGPWVDYLNRCQALLQHGLFAADVLYYNGDWVPNMVSPERVREGLGQGYDFDVCNEEVLLTRLSVKDGRLVLPDGMSYRLLVLPDENRMPAAVASKLAELVEAGATIIGSRPQSDPGLLNHPACDDEVRRVASELWGSKDSSGIRTVGKGRVIEGRSPREVLLNDGVQPDFEFHAGADDHLDFIHRADMSGDWYFVCNRNNEPAEATLTFRQEGRQPELWSPVTGDQRDLSDFEIVDGRTRVPMGFGPHESAFIVFRKPASKGAGPKMLSLVEVLPVSGPWTVRFDPDWFYPVKDDRSHEMKWEQLKDWTQHADHAVKHFSGTASYRTEFELPKDQATGAGYHLSLGEVSVTARVMLNGVDLGVAWCDPWRVEVTRALKPGKNHLVIEVVNTWQNRLVGDGFLPKDQRRTRTNIGHFYLQERRGKKIIHPPMPSGLKGPVTLLREAT